LYHWESDDETASPFSPLSKFYFDGKLVSNQDDVSDGVNTTDSEEPNLLTYLKSGFNLDDTHDESSDDFIFEMKDSNQELKTDEDMAAKPLCDPKMGPIFMQLYLEW
jgi:hypothetical protein